MAITQQLILTAPPECCLRASQSGLSVARLCYRVGKGGHLFRAELPGKLRGGLMGLSGLGFEGPGDPAQLCREIARECSAQGLGGVLCDLDGEPAPFWEKTLGQLGRVCGQRGWTLYVTESCGGVTEYSRVLVSTLLSAGTLEARLRTALARFGEERVVLAVQRAMEDYTLPSAAGEGKHLSRAELAARMKRFSPAVFFDHGLCAHHFTYMENSVAHFVLFDDGGSLRRKLALAAELGIRRAVLAFPEIEDILPQLLGR